MMNVLGFPVRTSEHLPENILMKMETREQVVFVVEGEDSLKLYKIDKDQTDELGYNNHGSPEPSV